MSRRSQEHSRTKRPRLKPRNVHNASSTSVASRALVEAAPLQRDPPVPSNSQSVAPPDAPTTASSGSSVTHINAEAPNAASPKDKPHSALPGKDALPESGSAIHEPVEQSTKATPPSDTSADKIDARLAEIEEILRHAGLAVLDKAALVAEWVKTSDRCNNSGQDVQEHTVGRPRGGIAQAARVLCVPGKTEEARRKFIEREMKIDAISSDAKDEARRLGLEDNQSALLAVANVTPEEQVAKVHERAERKRGRRRKQSITPDRAKDETNMQQRLPDERDVEMERLRTDLASTREALRTATDELAAAHGEMPPIPSFQPPLDPVQQTMVEDFLGTFDRDLMPKLTNAPNLVRDRVSYEITQRIRALMGNGG
jgi:hypothetical protein